MTISTCLTYLSLLYSLALAIVIEITSLQGATEMLAFQRFLIALSLACCTTILAGISAEAQMQQILSPTAAAGSLPFPPLHHFRIFNAVHHVQRQWGGVDPARWYSAPC